MHLLLFSNTEINLSFYMILNFFNRQINALRQRTFKYVKFLKTKKETNVGYHKNNSLELNIIFL